MASTMTSQSNRFTWLVALKRSLPRPRKLLRSLQHLNHIHSPAIILVLFFVIAKFNNLGTIGNAKRQNFPFFGYENVSGYFLHFNAATMR